tara:strand:+ start:131 stop:733 length:603 start_codon:yes stop_codon:yes gene_type:complete
MSSTLSPFGPPVYISKVDPKYIAEMIAGMEKSSEDPDTYSNRHRLAGRIEEQYEILPHVSEACVGHIFQHVHQFWHDIGSPLPKEGEVGLDALWVNIQRYMEFNPQHKHTGMLSFVIYIKNELNRVETINNKYDNARSSELAGHLELKYGEESYLNWVNFTHWPEEGDIIMFPSWLQHMVYPHYEEEKKRISVAGNIVAL